MWLRIAVKYYLLIKAYFDSDMLKLPLISILKLDQAPSLMLKFALKLAFAKHYLHLH